MDFPPWERLEVTDLSTEHPMKQGTNKEMLLHFTASESMALKQRRRQVFSTHYPWENPSWHPFNMGSSLPEWRPQPLGAPDTPSPWQAAPCFGRNTLAGGHRPAEGARQSGGREGVGTQPNDFKRIKFPRTSRGRRVKHITLTTQRNLKPQLWDWGSHIIWIKCDWSFLFWGGGGMWILPGWVTQANQEPGMRYVSFLDWGEVSRQMGMEMRRGCAHCNLAHTADPVITRGCLHANTRVYAI